MPSVETPAVSKAGITTSASGERHIPSSKRPDGSLRKEIKIRPGYRPPEDVEVYKNRTAESWRSKGSAVVPGSDSPTTTSSVANTTSANKNAKRREARKKAAAATVTAVDSFVEVNGVIEVDGGFKASAGPVENPRAAPIAENTGVADATNNETDVDKEAKKLTKKLRQARELSDKKEKGDTLLPEQFEKVIKINSLIQQLESLGFDANGEKKTKT